MILMRVEPLLCNDREISKYNRAVSRQRLNKQVPAATNTHATIEILLEMMFATRSVARGYKEKSWCSVRESEARRLQLERSRSSERTWAHKQMNSHCRNRYQETCSKRLRILDCVL
jgi:hypothetical protein